MAKKDYSALAKTIVESVGGKENVVRLIHCFTRLRFYLKDESIVKEDELLATKGVINVIKASGQYQVVIGNEVAQVFDAVMAELGTTLATDNTPTQNEQEGNIVTRNINKLIGTITGAMTPVIGVIAAAGIIKGLLALLTLPQLGSLLDIHSMFYISVSAIADSAFYFLPVIVGFSAARYMNGDPIITAVIGCVLTYPQIVVWGKSFTPMLAVGDFHFEFLKGLRKLT